MKTSYELAMDRLAKSSPAAKLSGDQKKALAELDSVYKAKIAQREIALQDELARAGERGDFEAIDKLQQQLVNERKDLLAKLEAQKEKIRNG